MEALGAASSILTGLEVSLKTAGFLYDILETQNDFKDLKQHLADIDGIIKRFKTLPTLFSGTQGLPEIAEELSLRQAIMQLQEIREEVNAIVKYCAKYPDDENSRAKKRKWILKRNTIPKLLEKARNTQRKIETALQVQTFTLMATKIVLDNRFQAECLMALQTLQNIHNTSISLPSTSGVVQEMDHYLENTVQLNDTAGTQDEEADNSILEPRSHEADAIDSTAESSKSEKRIFRTNLEKHAPYLQRCRCRCHSRRADFQAPSWVRPLLGSWRFEHSSRYAPEEIECPQVGCYCAKETRVNGQYHLPRWLGARTLLLTAAYGTGGLTFALRPTRILSGKNPIWRWLLTCRYLSCDLVESTLARQEGSRESPLSTYFPTDCIEYGETLMEYSLHSHNFTIVEIFLNHWKNLLLTCPFRRETGQIAHRLLQERHFYDDHSLYLLGQVVSCSDLPEQESSKILEAAQLGSGMAEAIEAEPWAIDGTDHTGQAPIHYAILNGDIESLRTLIGAKADINILDMSMSSPLDLATYLGWTEAMSLLITAGCAMGQNSEGISALHHAAYLARSDAIAALLAAGASAFMKDFSGRTPLHWLGDKLPPSKHSDTDIADANITDASSRAIHSNGDSTAALESVLIMAHESSDQRHQTRLDREVKKSMDLLLLSSNLLLEARDRNGTTPLMACIRWNKVHVIRHLIQAGASLQTTEDDGESVLHMAARYANAEILQLLLELDPAAFRGTSIYLRNVNGFTPWSVFLSFCTEGVDYVVSQYGRIPSVQERASFIQLHEVVRTENLRQDIVLLEDSVKLLQTGRHDDAEGQLNVLLEKERDWGRSDLVSWYRALIQLLHIDGIEQIEDAINDYISDLQEEIREEVPTQADLQRIYNLGIADGE